MTRASNSPIPALGNSLGPETLSRSAALFEAEQVALANRIPPLARDIAYGPHPRHRLDLYGPAAAERLPVLVFVHGGGFVLGDKGDAGRWTNANVGRMAADAGMIGCVINYRLAPEHGWPAGSEDVAAAVDWLRTHVAQHGGDPARIVLAGTSAGAIHIAGYLKLRPQHQSEVRGAILLSGLYGYTELDPKDLRYYAADAYAEQMPRAAVEETGLPLLIACAEFDPPRFQQEFVGVLDARLARHGALPRGHMASGHNHYSMAMHLGTADRRLADAMLEFVSDCCNRKGEG
jgi:acetyl esterase/lipase